MTKFALDQKVVTSVALAFIVIAGFNAFLSLPRNEDPGFIIRVALVMTQFPGASSERVENLVTDKIEEVAQEIPELDFVNSQSRTGVSLVFVNIKEEYKDMRPIWDNLRRKVDRIRPELPEGIIGPTVDDEFGDVFGILITMTGEGYTYKELKDFADDVRDELLLLPEAAKVEIYGAQEERVFIEYRDERLAELNLSVGQFQALLASKNIIIPGGDIRIDNERIALEPSGNFSSVEDVRNTVIKLPGSQDVVFLGDICEITRGYVDPPQNMVRSSGAPGLAIGISLREGGNVINLGEDVRATLTDLHQQLPIGIEFDGIANLPGRVDDKIRAFVSNLLQAIVIVLGVMLLSLGVRVGFLVAALIPTTMLASTLIMSLTGIGLDQMSLAALIISLGMLIDNAIVMSESIIVQMRGGKSAYQSAIDAGDELRIPLLTSSLTTAAAFLPIYLAKSTAGEYTGVIFIVVSLTLLASWVLALTMTPLLCVQFLKIKKSEGSGENYGNRFYRTYRSGLMFALRNRWLTVGAAVGLFVLGQVGMGIVPNIFFPSDDRAFFTAKLSLPTGTDIAETESMVQQVEQFMEDQLSVRPDREEGIVNWATFIGGGEPRWILTTQPQQQLPSYAYMLINTTSYDAVFPSIDRLQEYCDANFPDLIAKIEPSILGPPITKPIEVRLSGKDADELFRIADGVKAEIEKIPGTRNIDDSWGRRVKKFLIEVNESRARRAGVASEDVAISLQSHLSGLQVTDFREENDIIPVTLRSVEGGSMDVGQIESINVYSQTTGRPVPLKQVANLIVEWEPSKILRRNRQKTVTVEADLLPGVTATSVTNQLIPYLEENRPSWPRGYRYEMGGELETSVKSNRSIGEQMPIAVLIIVMLLVGQFNSIRKPIIILSMIPMALVGVTIGLIVFQSFFGFMTLLGLISLAGIVINNAIVLLDRIRTEQEINGLSPQDSIVQAAQRRLRPILLTTMTTVGGLVPLYLGGGPMWEPMAITIMAGLLFSTILTLGLVPVLYSIFYKVSFKGYAEPSA